MGETKMRFLNSISLILNGSNNLLMAVRSP